MSQTVLVTGASSGIGQATARLLAEQGFTVYGTSRKPDGNLIPLDVRSDDSVRACVERVGPIDVLVNNAGYSLMGAAKNECRRSESAAETNFFGVVRMVNAVLPAMRKAGAERSSTSARSPASRRFPSAHSTPPAKFALEGYSEALWHELRPLGINVTLIEPGFVHTPIGERRRSRRAAERLRRSPPARHGRARPPRGARYRARRGGQDRAGRRPKPLAVPSLPGGTDAAWLPRLKSVLPWPLFAVGVRRTFAV